MKKTNKKTIDSWKTRIYSSINEFADFEEYRLACKFWDNVNKKSEPIENSKISFRNLDQELIEGVVVVRGGGVDIAPNIPDSAYSEKGIMDDAVFEGQFLSFPHIQLTEQEAIELGKLLIKKAGEAKRLRERYARFVAKEFNKHNEKAAMLLEQQGA